MRKADFMNEIVSENWSQSVSEVAKNTSLSFSLNGWSAAAALISIPTAVVAIYAIKALVIRRL